MKLPTSKKAELSSIAISKSLRLTLDEARLILAQVFNFTSWDDFASKLPTETKIEPTEIYSLNQIIMEKLSRIIEVNSHHSVKSLVDCISPYSEQPKPYRLDLAIVNSEESNQRLDFDQLRDIVESNSGEHDSDDSMMSHLKEIISMSGIDPSGEIGKSLIGVTFDELQGQMRQHKRIDPVANVNALEHIIGIETEIFEEDGPMMQVGYYIDMHGEQNPLFVTPMVATPGDSQDSAFIEHLEKVKVRCNISFEKPMVLMGTCAFKKMQESVFGVVGLWYDKEDWRWIFLAEIAPWEQKKLFKETLLNNLETSLDEHTLPKELSVPENDFVPDHLLWHTIVAPIDEPQHEGEGVSFTVRDRPVITGVSGWSTFV
jgi:hypothetical protein